MSSEANTVKLDKLVKIKGGKRLPKGENLQTDKNDHPYIRVRDMGNKFIPRDGLEYVPDDVFPEIERYIVEEGDLIISIVGTIGLTSIIDEYFHTASQTENCAKLSGLDNVDGEYLYYFLISKTGQDDIHKNTVGAVQKKLPLYGIKNIDVIWPERAKREVIVNHLSSLDQKIHLNQQTNKTLEAMAQAIFKSWFVDFDPVRAKIEAKSASRDPNRAALAAIAGISLEQDWDEIESALDQKLARMSEAQQQQLTRTAQLFPDELVESEIGEVPKGWGKKPFKKICKDIQSGGTPKRSETEYWGRGYSWLSSGEIRNRYLLKSDEQITEKGLAESNAKLWPSGSTIIAMYGATAGVTAYLANEMCANQACCCLIPHQNSAFVFISALRASRELSGKSTGSAQQNLNKGIIERHKVLFPSDELIDAFENIASPLIEKIITNEEQKSSLSELRDTLLPKLISGEIQL